MICFGEVPASSVLPIFFDSFSGSTGASITITGLAVTDIEIYKAGSTTQRASDAGYTLLDTDGIDFDGITGIHGFSVDLGDNTDAGFYAVGSFYTVVVSAVTIDSQTVSFVAATFRIKAAEAIAGKPKVDVDGWLGTACATPTVNGVPEVDVTHIAGATTDVSTIPASIAAILVDTGTTLDGKLDTIDDFLDTEVADIRTRVLLALPAVAPAANGGLPTVDASNLVAGIQGTKQQLDDLNDVSAAGVNAEVVDALATDTYAEPTGVPAATVSLASKIGRIHEALRNKVTITATKKIFYDDADAALWEKDVSDDGVTYTETESNAP